MKICHLLSEQWKNKLIQSLQSSIEDNKQWPIMNPIKCHCGKWIKRVEEDGLFEKKWLNQLEQAHEVFHTIAYDLHIKYLEGTTDLQQDDLDEFHTSFDDFIHILQRCK